MYWVEFVGEGRSGHTIVSAILGCHPHIRMAEEQKYLNKWCRDPATWTREAIFQHLFQSGVGRARGELRFKHDLLLSYQEPLQVVGDKCGWAAVTEVRRRQAPDNILTLFGEHVGLPVKTLVTLRNPLDNISAWITSPKYIRMFPDEDLRYRAMIKRYRKFHDHAIRVLAGQDTYFLYNERLIAEPGQVLREMETWLGLEPNRDWRRYCESRINKKPNQRHLTFDWPEHRKESVLRYINSCPLLEYYR